MMTSADFGRIGNELCLDFHNTVSWSGGEPAGEDLLPDFESVLLWCESAGTAAPELLALVADRSDGAAREAILQQAHDLRAVLHDVFDAIARGAAPRPEHLEELNDFLASVLMRVEWETEGEPALSTGAAGGLSELLAPVVWSAAALLVSPYRDKVRACGGKQCGRLFVDLSRRGNRRWCDMSGCGNRAKAGRFYARTRVEVAE